MLDLRSMSDEEFSVLVTPSVPQAAMYVRVEESGKILLSSKGKRKTSPLRKPRGGFTLTSYLKKNDEIGKQEPRCITVGLLFLIVSLIEW